jgi:hypothetical protein
LEFSENLHKKKERTSSEYRKIYMYSKHNGSSTELIVKKITFLIITRGYLEYYMHEENKIFKRFIINFLFRRVYDMLLHY